MQRDQHTPRPGQQRRRATNQGWLLKLRWAAAMGQLITIGVTTLAVHVSVNWLPLLALIGVTVVSNTALQVWFRRKDHSQSDELSATRVIGSVMLLDLLLLTAMLYLAGGATNPFCVFYLVNISLAAILLPTFWAWIVCSLAVGCFAALFMAYQPISELGRFAHRGEDGLLASYGLFAAFSTCAFLLVYFITRLTSEIQQSEEALRESQQQKARSEKFESLGTLSAGAAHELASPLSTIAIASGELESQLSVQPSLDQQAIEDVRLIRSQVERCRLILDRLSADAGESVELISVADLVATVLSDLPMAERVVASVDNSAAGQTLHCARVTLGQAIRGVVQNALDATSAGQAVRVDVGIEDHLLRIRVRDSGQGIAGDIIELICDPFFTTKPPGQGMGLGLFLAKTVVEKFGGGLAFESAPGRGTVVIIHLPISERPDSLASAISVRAGRRR